MIRPGDHFPGTDAPVRPPHLRRRILLVEDHAALAEATAQFLDSRGLAVRIVSSGREALDAAAVFHPEIVLCDTRLPDMSGFDVARKLRENLRTKGALIAMHSAMADTDTWELIRNLHAPEVDLFISKPLTEEKLNRLFARLDSRTASTDIKQRRVRKKRTPAFRSDSAAPAGNGAKVPIAGDGFTMGRSSRTSYKKSAAKDKRKTPQSPEQIAMAEGPGTPPTASSWDLDEFLLTLSHDLRTPLNTILSWAQILRLGGIDPAKIDRAVFMIEKCALEQRQLLDDLIDISRIRAGRLALHVGQIEITDCLRAALNSIQSMADNKQVKIETAFDPAAGKITGDADRLQQVFRKILANAVEFSPSRGKITVRLSRITDLNQDRVEVQIEDTGKGIAPELLPHLFKRFSDADSVSTRVHSLGFGLSIARDLVEMHGGTIIAQSPGEGKGAVFTISLPCRGTTKKRSAVDVSV